MVNNVIAAALFRRGDVLRANDVFTMPLPPARELTILVPGLVLAFGIADDLPEIPGLAERWGRTVLHCPYCHGFEQRGHRVAQRRQIADAHRFLAHRLQVRNLVHVFELVRVHVPDPVDPAGERRRPVGIGHRRPQQHARAGQVLRARRRRLRSRAGAGRLG